MDKVHKKNMRGISLIKLSELDKIIIIISSIVLSCSVILSTRFNYLITVCIIASILFSIIYMIRYGYIPIYKCAYLWNSLLFVFLVALSAIWAYWEITPPLANALQIFIFLIPNFLLFSYIVRNKNDVKILLYILEFSAFLVAIYTLNFYGTAEFSRLLHEGKRFGNEFANSNAIGVFIVTGVLACVYDILFIKVNIFKSFLIFPCVYIIAYSGSRKALIALAVGSFLLWIRRFKGKNVFTTVIKSIIAIAFIVLIGAEILSLPIFSMILERIDLIRYFNSDNVRTLDHASYLRKIYIIIGISAFLRSPIWGIGIGNTNTLIYQRVGRFAYTHNNYVEMLASLGIIGFVIYYMMWLKPLLYVVKAYYKSKFSDPEAFFCIVLVLILLLLDFAMVPYLDFSNYFYIMLIAAEAYLIKRGSIVSGDRV